MLCVEDFLYIIRSFLQAENALNLNNLPYGGIYVGGDDTPEPQNSRNTNRNGLDKV